MAKKNKKSKKVYVHKRSKVIEELDSLVSDFDSALEKINNFVSDLEDIRDTIQYSAEELDCGGSRKHHYTLLEDIFADEHGSKLLVEFKKLHDELYDKLGNCSDMCIQSEYKD